MTELSAYGLGISVLVPPGATLTKLNEEGQPVVHLTKGEFHLELREAAGLSADEWLALLPSDREVSSREANGDSWTMVVSTGEQQFTFATSRGGVICQSSGVAKSLLKQVEKLCGTIERSKAAEEPAP